MPTLTVLAELVARPGHGAHLRKELSSLVTPTLAEPGCLAYRVWTDAADPDRVLLVERWQNEVALQEHFAMPYFREAAAVLPDLLASPLQLERLWPATTT
jgi:quinol monooxygenase YgiN